MAEKDVAGSPAPEINCPVCRENGSDSQVMITSESQTYMKCLPYIGKGGKQHLHDSNIFSTEYECSNGHKWVDRESGKCWCGWKGEVLGPTRIIRKR